MRAAVAALFAASRGCTSRLARGAATMSSTGTRITTLIFDIDDTLYPVSCGFSAHRNGPTVTKFMVEVLGFESAEVALKLRDEVFKEHHSTLKGLLVASAEGRLPRPLPHKEALGEFWAQHCDFDTYVRPNHALSDQLTSLRDDAGMKLVAFTNAPRAYGRRCLEALAVAELFPDAHLFGVEDVLPACKPERAAFEAVLGAVGSAPTECVMFEDSMKNIRACRALGIRTVFIDENAGGAGEATLLGDTKTDCDTIDATIRRIEHMKQDIPQLWDGRV